MFIALMVDQQYLDVTYDYAFKMVFSHERILLMLLNDILPEKIRHINYKPAELPRLRNKDKKVLFDLFCETEDGKKIIVEMQRSRESDHRDRLFYYGAELVTSQKQSGELSYQLHPVYVICIMDYSMKHPSAPKDKLMFCYSFMEEQTHEKYGNQMSAYFLELPRIKQVTGQLGSPVAEWFYILKNLSNFARERKGHFGRYEELVAVARTDGLSEVELNNYLRSMITEHDRITCRRAGFEDGYEEGREEGRVSGLKAGWEEGIAKGREEGIVKGREEVAVNLLSLGSDVAFIAKATGLTEQEISALRSR